MADHLHDLIAKKTMPDIALSYRQFVLFDLATTVTNFAQSFTTKELIATKIPADTANAPHASTTDASSTAQ